MRSEPGGAAENHQAMIERIQNAAFHTAWWGKGYDEKEVDDFLDGLTKALRQGRRLGPAELRDAGFTVTWLRPGYVMTEVDDLLDDVARYAGG